MRNANVWAAIALLGAIISPARCDEVSDFRIPIRSQYDRIYNLTRDVEKHFAANDRSEATVEGIRAGLCVETAAYEKLLKSFRDAKTRHGLDEEFLLLRESLLSLSEVASMYAVLSGKAYAPPTMTEQERDELLDRVFEDIAWYTRMRLDEALKAKGLADILLAGSFEEARDEAVAQMREYVEESVADEMERLTGLRFYSAATLGEVLGVKARAAVERGIAKLLVRVTHNHLIISVATTVLLRWLGPKIKEALRQKGNHEARIVRSAATIEAARRRLNALPKNADLRDVSAALTQAKRAINATKYLRSDLIRARKWADLPRITDPIGHLTYTIFLTNHRFMLDKPAYTEHYKLAESGLADIRRLAACTGREAVAEAQDATPTSDPENEIGPIFLVHECRFKRGDEWMDREQWMALVKRPDEDNVFGTLGPNAQGRPTTFLHKADRVLGPFTTKTQLRGALRQVGVESILLPWMTTVYADPTADPNYRP